MPGYSIISLLALALACSEPQVDPPRTMLVPLRTVRTLPLGRDTSTTPGELSYIAVGPDGIAVVDNASRLLRTFDTLGEPRWLLTLGSQHGAVLRQPNALTWWRGHLFVADVDPREGVRRFDDSGRAVDSLPIDLATPTTSVSVLGDRLVLGTTGHDADLARGGTISRAGGGPGELMFPQLLTRTIDGLGVLDGQKQALVTFDTAGVPLGDLSIDSLVGAPATRITGLRQTGEGQWVYSVIEDDGRTRSEALYLRNASTARLLARTPSSPLRSVTAPCGVVLPAEPPVFWPTMRWDTMDGYVAWSADVDYRVVVLNLSTGDSVVHRISVASPPATRTAALNLRIGTTVQTGTGECTLSREDALAQRGMTERLPAINRLTLAPGGSPWTQLNASRPGPGIALRHRRERVDSIAFAPFPARFLPNGDFLALIRDADESVRLEIWRLR